MSARDDFAAFDDDVAADGALVAVDADAGAAAVGRADRRERSGVARIRRFKHELRRGAVLANARRTAVAAQIRVRARLGDDGDRGAFRLSHGNGGRGVEHAAATVPVGVDLQVAF